MRRALTARIALSVLVALAERFASFGRTGSLAENNRREALLPHGASVLENLHGTAPGFVALRADGKFVACVPGVPREMKPMLAERLVPWIFARHGFASRDPKRVCFIPSASANRISTRASSRCSGRSRIRRSRCSLTWRFGADVTVASNSIAGPTGATERKPVGLVYVAVGSRTRESTVKRSTLPGNRADVRRRTTVAALNMLWQYLDAGVPTAR